MSPTWQPGEVTLALPARGEDLRLAEQLGIGVAAARDPTNWQLVTAEQGVELVPPREVGDWRVGVDVRSGALARRLRTARRDEPLARAIGLPKRPDPPTVLDATAGLARDAMVLAELGCQVVACERVPAFVFLVTATLRSTALAERLRVELADAAARLAALEPGDAPDVVYLDPMFAATGSAQVKKEMQACRALAAPPEDAAELLRLARAVARDRVVVKRHPHEAPLAEPVSFAVAGTRVRFDVYLTAAPKETARPR